MKHVSHRRAIGTALGLAAMLTQACSGQVTGGGDGSDGGSNDIPFEPVDPSVYVPKVKNLMTGLNATDAEIAAVVADPKALRAEIDTWMALPEFQARMLDFFRNAFQQNQVTLADLTANIGGTNINNLTQFNGAYTARFERSLMDSFPMTAWELVQEGRPFTETLTTNRYMLTTAMMSVLSYVDEKTSSDTGKGNVDRLAQRNALPGGFTLDPNTTATLDQTLDPNNANYMKWKDPVVAPTGCTLTAVPYVQPTTGDLGSANYRTLFMFMFGNNTYTPCPTANATIAPAFADADWSDWHMVTINQADAATPTSPVFWDIIKARTATAMTLHIPRIGFSGTLAFAANWGTNSSNEARVTANQALIVALGQSIAGDTTVVPFPVTATDSAHATDPACAGCHAQLDPMKQYFRQSYTLSYHDQLDATQLPGSFNIDGANATGNGIGDLMTTMGAQSRFGIAWTQKLQFWANSTPAQEDDPEVLRIAGVFQASNYDFKTLVEEVFSSPLVHVRGADPDHAPTGGRALDHPPRSVVCVAVESPRLAGYLRHADADADLRASCDRTARAAAAGRHVLPRVRPALVADRSGSVLPAEHRSDLRLGRSAAHRSQDRHEPLCEHRPDDRDQRHGRDDHEPGAFGSALGSRRPDPHRPLRRGIGDSGCLEDPGPAIHFHHGVSRADQRHRRPLGLWSEPWMTQNADSFAIRSTVRVFSDSARWRVAFLRAFSRTRTAPWPTEIRRRVERRRST